MKNGDSRGLSRVGPIPFFLGGGGGGSWQQIESALVTISLYFVGCLSLINQCMSQLFFFIIIQAFSWPKPLAKKIPELERENDKTI